ncbi:MAG TPA: hypothetical protein VK391_05950 [Allosphingosinicella sp.]|nr:hypothetical protein [Allosphingosinicella sp.]
MTKAPTFVLPFCLLGAACAQEPQPDPDPAAVEKFLYSQDHQVSENVIRTERVIKAVEKAPLERVDPNVAIALLD